MAASQTFIAISLARRARRASHALHDHHADKAVALRAFERTGIDSVVAQITFIKMHFFLRLAAPAAETQMVDFSPRWHHPPKEGER